MRYFFGILTLLSLGLTNTYAGIFEYKVVEKPSAGVEKQIITTPLEQYINQGTYDLQNRYSRDVYYNDPYSYTKYPSRSYYDDIRAQNGYYSYTEIKHELEQELKRLERRADYIDDEKADIKRDLRKYKKYSSSWYRDLRRELEYNLDELEDEEQFVEDQIDDIEDELRDVKRYKNINTYYYYDGRHYDGYSSTYYYDHSDYYYYNDYSYHNRYSRKKLINPYLKESRDGRVYLGD